LRRTLVTGLGLLLGGWLGACETVDLGAPPADVNACRPSQSYFVNHIWPDVLNATYGGKHCADSQCHGVGTQTPFALIADPQPAAATFTMAATPSMAMPMPDPIVTLPLPDDWSKNYRAASQEMNCDDPTASQLVTTPTSPTHGGNMLFSATSTEVTEIEKWVSVTP
jgi:hypothetical protein